MLHRTNSFSCFQIVSLFRCTITHRFAKWYKITLLSNTAFYPLCTPMFYYLMKLHYSQTTVNLLRRSSSFYYLMKLHYSQTTTNKTSPKALFYYLMKLHYSQTSNENKLRHYNSQGNIIKWLYYKPKIIFLQQFRTYLYPKYKDFLAEVSESCFDFQ